MKPNSISFIALSNEYCRTIENARSSDPAEFVATMLRLLPRIYISATDLAPEQDADDNADDIYIENVLEEDYYESKRRDIENLLGEADSYLEVFEEDMRYSDTPIAASVAEGLADIFQVLYNFVALVHDAPDSLVEGALAAVREDFSTYWSRPLCNVLRALNNIRYFSDFARD